MEDSVADLGIVLHEEVAGDLEDQENRCRFLLLLRGKALLFLEGEIAVALVGVDENRLARFHFITGVVDRQDALSSKKDGDFEIAVNMGMAIDDPVDQDLDVLDPDVLDELESVFHFFWAPPSPAKSVTPFPGKSS